MKNIVFLLILLVFTGCSSTKLNNNFTTTSMIEVVELGGIDSLRIIYEYRMVNNEKILKSIIHSKLIKLTETSAKERRIFQEIYFDKQGKLIDYSNYKDIIIDKTNGDILYDIDQIIINKSTNKIESITWYDNHTPVLDIYRSKDVLLDMRKVNLNNGNGIKIYNFADPSRPITFDTSIIHINDVFIDSSSSNYPPIIILKEEGGDVPD